MQAVPLIQGLALGRKPNFNLFSESDTQDFSLPPFKQESLFQVLRRGKASF